MTERCNGQLQEGVGEGTGVKNPHAAPQRRPSMVHREANTLAGDLHTSQPTKKDAKEVRTAPVQSLFFIPPFINQRNNQCCNILSHPA